MREGRNKRGGVRDERRREASDQVGVGEEGGEGMNKRGGVRDERGSEASDQVGVREEGGGR